MAVARATGAQAGMRPAPAVRQAERHPRARMISRGGSFLPRGSMPHEVRRRLLDLSICEATPVAVDELLAP